MFLLELLPMRHIYGSFALVCVRAYSIVNGASQGLALGDGDVCGTDIGVTVLDKRTSR